MTRRRIVPFAMMLGLTGLGITILTAAKEAPPVEKPSAKEIKVEGKRLVCQGVVDIEGRVIELFPPNFPLPSKIIEVCVKEGDVVKKDHVLLRLDDKLAKLRVKEAAAAVKMAEKELGKAQAQVDAHTYLYIGQDKVVAIKKDELTAAEQQVEELERALRNKIGNEFELKQAQTKVSGMKKAVEAEEIKLKGLRNVQPTALVDLAQAAIEKQQVLLEQANEALGQMEMKAETPGKIQRSFVTAGLAFGPQTKQPAFWFQPEGPLIVRAEVQQEFASRLTLGQSATIVDEADPKSTWKGQVTKIADTYLPKRSAGGIPEMFQVNEERVLEFLVSIELKPDSPPIRLGQKVRVNVGE